MRVDRLANTLRTNLARYNYQVESHHGSLDKSVREHTEAEIKLRDRVVAVASSTLEIGIDIGDIDLVVLDGPPPDVSSLLQRIGRGNRRRATTRVLPCWNNEGEQVILNAMLLAAKAGDLGAPVSGKQFAVPVSSRPRISFRRPTTGAIGATWRR